jgi:hypothetical protein
VPNAIINAYMPAFSAAATFGGVSEERLRALIAATKNMTPERIAEFFNSFFGTLFRLIEIDEFMALSMSGKMDRVRSNRNETEVAGIRRLDERIAVLSQGFETMSLEEQIALGEQLMPLIEDRYQRELAWIDKVTQAMDASLESIDRQIWGLRFAQQAEDPQAQMDMLLDRQRFLRRMIENAQSPEELQRWLSEFQQNIDQMVQLGGARPEDYDQGIAMLEDIRAVAEQRFLQFIEWANQQDQEIYERIRKILETLQTGVEGIAGGQPGLPGNPPGGIPPERIQEAENATIAFTGALTAATMAVETFSARVSPISEAVNEPPMTVNVNVEVAPPAVNVSGDIGPLISDITSAATRAAVQQSVGVIRGRAARAGRL